MYNSPYYLPNPPYFASSLQPIEAPAPQMEIQRVQGEESAKAFRIGPNSSVILLDMNDPLIWFVSTDASGYKTVKPFTITPYIPEQPVSASDLESRMSEINMRLEKLEERMSNYGQSNNGASWKNKSGNANAGSNVRNGQNGQGSAGNSPANVAE